MMTMSVMARQASAPQQMKSLCQQQTTCLTPNDIGGKMNRTVVVGVHQSYIPDGVGRPAGNISIHGSSIHCLNAKNAETSGTRLLVTSDIETTAISMSPLTARSD
jgi:hypothetical protein